MNPRKRQGGEGKYIDSIDSVLIKCKLKGKESGESWSDVFGYSQACFEASVLYLAPYTMLSYLNPEIPALLIFLLIPCCLN